MGKNENNEIILDMGEDIDTALEEEIIKKLLQSEEDYENGRVRDAEEVFAEWRLKYGV